LGAEWQYIISTAVYSKNLQTTHLAKFIKNVTYIFILLQSEL